MGKEYITDTITLQGDITFNEKTQTQSKITQINYEGLNGETQSALASQTTLAEASINPVSKTTISLGGFVDSESQFINEEETTATKIKIYTGEQPSKNLIEFYPGQERFTIDKRGYVGINNPNIDSDLVTLDVRSTTAFSTNPEFPPRLNTPAVAITHPYYNNKAGKPPTPQYIGRLQFRSIQNPDEGGLVVIPTDMAAIQVETDGQANVYEDARVSMSLNTNTGDGEGRPTLVKHLEINGYKNRTKIFTQLNLGNVPVFRSQEEAVDEGKLVNGDVYQDREQNLKIVFLLEEEEGDRFKVEQAKG